VAPVPLERVLRSLDPDTLRVEWHGSVHGQTTRLVCAYLHCDETFNPLVESLPALIIAQPFKSRVRLVSASESGGGDLVTLAGRSSQRLARSFADMAGEAESERPGSRVMLARMAELMFIDVLRRCVDSEGIRDTGWLAAVRDRQVGRALGLMHARPDEKWTVARLGKESGVSRSALGDRFRTLIGEPPMQYLTCLRMQRAMQLLREPGQSIAEIAPRVGYDSAVAFHRAFKRTVGQTPAEWRRAQLSA
jgi:AraC-like DNA-binding protein